jgi:predicted ATPase
MRFQVVPHGSRVPSAGANVGYLQEDNWNDYWEYHTLYALTIFDHAGIRHELGGIKIGQFNWQQGQIRPRVPAQFEHLSEEFFSLGQDVSYYERMPQLGSEVSAQILASLKDVVIDSDLFTRASSEEVMGTSLLRSVTVRSVEGQFRRVLAGGVVLTEYQFSYEGPQPSSPDTVRLKLEFTVAPDSKPPTNIHVLIGRNGVGKSFLLQGMTRALISEAADDVANGFFETREAFFSTSRTVPFANLVSVTFSAFDEFTIVPESRNALQGIRYSNIGLRKRVTDENDASAYITLEPAALADEFSISAGQCVVGARAARWRDALETLEADPIFQEANVTSLAAEANGRFAQRANALFKNLSSGHKIVLLTITKLVEKVEEKTLVLMDEPEAHLHPPLLSAFVRALSDLLINRNGVAIIATHSPVILQEVPASCVWKIVRHGHAARADRPEIETFAENVGILTKEVFGLEVTRSGFHRMLADEVNDLETVDDVLRRFDNEVGSEGRALISALIAARNARRGS